MNKKKLAFGILYVLGVVALLISQFYLIVHFLWAESIVFELAIWIGGIFLVALGYFVLIWSKNRISVTGKMGIVMKVLGTVVTLFILGVGIVTPCCFILSEKQGDVIEGTVPEQHVPIEYARVNCEERGTMTELSYETPVYDVDGNKTGETVQKRLRVYLPAGYNENEKYDILYMLNIDENLYFSSGSDTNMFRMVFDHMIYNKQMNPTIVVACATGTQSSQSVDEDTQMRFQYELREVILPLVESTYSTYAESTDAAGLEASRKHRMVTGFSNGGLATMNTFLNNLDNFYYFIVTGGSLFDNATVPERLMAAVDKSGYTAEDYVLLMATGGRDMSYPGLVEQYELIQKEASEYFVLDSTLIEGNFCMQIGENYRHGADAMLSYLYVYLPMINEHMGTTGLDRHRAQVIIETAPAQKEGYETFATKLPLDKELKKESDKQGTVVEFTYETRAYALEQSSKKKEIRVTKKALVYLPYGYDESKMYDILYLMHGGGESEYYWLGDETMISGKQKTFGKTTRNVLDNMIASGLSKEVIVVAPTFYTEGNNAYVDGNALCIAFAEELREDLIPAIESKYSTYAGKDTSVEGLQKSRDHRAFAGFSMGSFTTIQAAMMRNLDVFSYFGAMSGSLTELSDFKDVLESEEYKDLPIHYMYNGNGTNDIAHDEHKELCIDILAEMSDRFVDGENFAWIDYEGGYHAYNSWITDLHNCLTVFFQ